MVTKALRVAAIVSAVAVAPLVAQQSAPQLVTVRHATGQGVAPVYEGFDINPDGSYNMWFGYMNRNYEEAVDLAIGPSNAFEPGGDRGQPTHFVPRRHKDVFRVVVPNDFGNQTLVWKLSSHGQTQQVVATLKPVWQIDRQRTTRGGNSEKISSNLPPVVSVEAASTILAAPTSTTLSLTATDDGLPKRRGEPVGLTVLWAKYRGPGEVRFSSTTAKLENGKTILVEHCTNLPRPYSRIHMVQGTKGLFQGYPNRVYIEGRGKEDAWVNADDVLNEFEHPLWKEIAAQAQGAGHGGMDFIEDYRLIKCLREGTPTDFNVYDAAAISAVVGLSVQSVTKKSAAAEFPDFTRGAWKTAAPVPIFHM